VIEVETCKSLGDVLMTLCIVWSSANDEDNVSPVFTKVCALRLDTGLDVEA
jgi:hypothetical protein